MIDLNTTIKNEFLRFLYSILLPGAIISFPLTIFIVSNTDMQFLDLLGLNRLSVFISLLIFFSLILGYICEILGAWIEAKYIDEIIDQKTNNSEFDRTWKEYLLIDAEYTKSIILVQYYRTLLTKFKFLINFPLSLWGALLIYMILINMHHVNETFGVLKINQCKLISISIIVISLISIFSFKRAITCGEILHTSRKEILELHRMAKFNAQRIGSKH